MDVVLGKCDVCGEPAFFTDGVVEDADGLAVPWKRFCTLHYMADGSAVDEEGKISRG